MPVVVRRSNVWQFCSFIGSCKADADAGDLQRPRCSRCLETDSQCVYSAVKRRPGPRKGWTRSAKGQAAHGVVASGSGVDHERLRSTHNLETSSLPAASVSRNPTIVNGDASWTPPPPLMAPPSERSTLNHLSFDLKPEQARALYVSYHMIVIKRVC